MATRLLILWLTSSTRLKLMQTTHWVQQKVPQREFLNPNRMWVSQKRCWQNFEGNVGRPDFWAKVAQSGLRWPKLSGNAKPCEKLFFGTAFTHTSYLSFFLHEQNYWRIKFTPKKRVNYNKIHRKLSIFSRYYGKIHSKLPIFRVKCVKIYTGQKNLHWRRRPRRRQLSGMDFALKSKLWPPSFL